MGRIKSATEIALEKTKHMSAPDKSDKEERYLEYVKAAGVLASSLIDNKTDPESVIKALERYPAEAKEPVNKVLFKHFAEGISFNNTPGIIKVIRHITSDEVTLKSCEEVNRIYEDFKERIEAELQEARQKDNNKLSARLAREGIKGSAIYQINIKDEDDSHNLAATVSARLEDEYHTQLSGFRSFLSCKA